MIGAFCGARGVFGGRKARRRGVKRGGLFGRRRDARAFLAELRDLGEGPLEPALRGFDRRRDRPPARVEFSRVLALLVERRFGSGDGLRRRIKTRFRRRDALALGGFALRKPR